MRKVVFGILSFIVVACQFPRDQVGTLERVRGGELKVGFTVEKPWVEGSDEPGGIEPALIRAFAAQLNARLLWVPGSTDTLMKQLEERKLDLVIGGLKDDCPWGSKVGLTQPYAQEKDDKQVMAVPPGENAWLVALERFLLQKQVKP